MDQAGDANVSNKDSPTASLPQKVLEKMVRAPVPDCAEQTIDLNVSNNHPPPVLLHHTFRDKMLRAPLPVHTTHGLVLKPNSCNRKHPISKVYTRSSSKYYEFKKIKEIQKKQTLDRILRENSDKAKVGDQSITDIGGKTSSDSADRISHSSEQKFFDDVKCGKYKRPSMLELFQKTFSNENLVPNADKDLHRYIPSKSTENTNTTMMKGRGPCLLDNTVNNIEFTDTLTNVCKLFSSFVGEKAKLLRSIGFHGLCSFPDHGSFDLGFYIWILSNIDVRMSTLDIGRNRRIPIRDYDISLITGLPCRGHSVIRNEKSHLVKRNHASLVKEFLSVAKQDALFTVPYVHSVVNREYSSPMSARDKYGFCIAATIYAVSSFLAVESGKVRFPFEILHSVIDPLEIKSHNWCQLVRKSFLTQAIYVQNQLSRGLKTIKVGGCPFLVMVYYLDNVHFGMNVVPDYVYPRGSLYTEVLVDKLINMDTKINDLSNKRQYGNHEFKRDFEVCYSRTSENAATSVVSSALNNKRKTPDYEKLDILVEKEVAARNKAVNHVGRQLSVGELILKAHQNMSGTKSVTPLGKTRCYVSLNDISKRQTFDLNVDITGEYSSCDGKDQAQIEGSSNNMVIDEQNHIEMYDYKLSKCMQFYNRVIKSKNQDLSCVIWFEHSEPSLIRISGQTFRDEANRGKKYGKDYTDTVLRMLTTIEDKKYLGSRKREKHFMPLSWSYGVLRGSQLFNLDESKDFFISTFFKYDFDKCTKIVVPVDLEGKQSCYIWDLTQKEITVLDPVMMTSPITTIKSLHEGVVLFLNENLVDCINSFFPLMQLDKTINRIVYKNDISRKCRPQNSGVYAMHYAQFYTDNHLVVPIDNCDLGEIRGRHLWEVITMEGNSVAIPLSLSIIKYVDSVATGY